MSQLITIPFATVDVAANGTKRVVGEARFPHPIEVVRMRYFFEPNTQNTVELFPFANRSPIADSIDKGLNLMPDYGTSVSVTGDGHEGEQVLEMGKELPAGYWLGGKLVSSSAAAHKVTWKYEVRIIRPSRRRAA